MMVATEPLMIEGDFLGSVDFILRLNDIIYKKYDKNDVRDVLVLGNIENLKKAKYIKNPIKVGSYYLDLGSYKPDDRFLKAAKNLDFNMLREKGYYIDDTFFYTYKDIKNNKGKNIGIFLIGKPIEMVQATVNKTEKTVETLMGIVFIAVIITLLIVPFLIEKIIIKPLLRLKHLSEEISSGEGDLTKRLEIKTEDEIGKTSHIFNKFIEKVHDIVSHIMVSANMTLKGVNSISSTLKNVNEKIDAEADLILKSNEFGNDIKELLDKTTFNSVEAANKANDALEHLSEAQKEITSLVDSVNSASENEKSVADSISDLSNKAESIKNVLELISNIAENTNLLALNAAIEAARAGEHGRGFAVVADNIRELAEKTQDSLSTIDIYIKEMVQTIEVANKEMGDNINSFSKLVNKTYTVSDKMRDSMGKNKESFLLAESTKSASQLLAKKVEEIIKNINDIHNLSTQNRSLLGKTDNNVNALEQNAKELTKQLGRFKI